MKEGAELLHSVLAIVPADSAERVDALYAMARLADSRADSASAARLARDCLALAEERRDVTRAGWALHLLGCIHIYTQEHDAARTAFDRVLSSDIDDDLRAATLLGLGELLIEVGKWEEARDVALSALALALPSNASLHLGRAQPVPRGRGVLLRRPRPVTRTPRREPAALRRGRALERARRRPGGLRRAGHGR
jgi:tetratricopeptide (TPR) repeat protein